MTNFPPDAMSFLSATLYRVESQPKQPRGQLASLVTDLRKKSDPGYSDQLPIHLLFKCRFRASLASVPSHLHFGHQIGRLRSGSTAVFAAPM